MNKPASCRYRITNRKPYNQALRRRGMQLVWLDKVLFGVPLRQRTGMVIILLRMAGLDFSSLSRRQKASTAQITNRRAAGPLNVLIDNEARTMCW